MDVLSANHFYLYEDEIKSVFRGEIPCWKLVYASDRKSQVSVVRPTVCNKTLLC